MTELEQYKANLEKLKARAARHGMDVPLPLQNEIEFHEQKIRELIQGNNRKNSSEKEFQLERFMPLIFISILLVFLFSDKISTFYATSQGVEQHKPDTSQSGGLVLSATVRFFTRNNEKCVSVTLQRKDVEGLRIREDKTRISSSFDKDGNADICGINSDDDNFSISILDSSGKPLSTDPSPTALSGSTSTPTLSVSPIPSASVPSITLIPQGNSRLRVAKINSNEDPSCISAQIKGVDTRGWRIRVDGLGLAGNMDAQGNGRICGLAPNQEITMTIFDQRGSIIQGGRGIPARGGDIFVANWR